MAKRRNRRPHALELPALNGPSFPLTIGSASSEMVATIAAKAANDSGIKTLLATEFENQRRNTRS